MYFWPLFTAFPSVWLARHHQLGYNYSGTSFWELKATSE